MDDLFANGKWAFGNLRQAITGIFTKTNLPLASDMRLPPANAFPLLFIS